MELHINNYSNGDQKKEHEKHGLIEETKKIIGKSVKVLTVRRNSSAWNIIEELIKFPNGYYFVKFDVIPKFGVIRFEFDNGIECSCIRNLK